MNNSGLKVFIVPFDFVNVAPATEAGSSGVCDTSNLSGGMWCEENEKGGSNEPPLSMPRTGFEPAHLSALPPQSSASANSATWAWLRLRRNYTPVRWRVERKS